MKEQLLSSDDLTIIITAIIMGSLGRILTIKEDYRQYPSYPNGLFIHIITGFVAAALGAVALPALMTKNFVAVTFLTLALQQFRDVRKMEKESLNDLENTEYTYRGSAYIDGIAKTFEARNYIAFTTALVTSIAVSITHNFSLIDNFWLCVLSGIIVGFVIMLFLKRFTKGKSIGDIAEIELASIHVKDSELFVNDIYVSNLLGTDNAQKLFREEGLAVVIKPHENHFRINLDNFGQRQAALFEACRALGVKRYSFTRKDYLSGQIVITLVPIKNEPNALIEAVKKCPLIESTKKAHSIMKGSI